MNGAIGYNRSTSDRKLSILGSGVVGSAITDSRSSSASCLNSSCIVNCRVVDNCQCQLSWQCTFLYITMKSKKSISLKLFQIIMKHVLILTCLTFWQVDNWPIPELIDLDDDSLHAHETIDLSLNNLLLRYSNVPLGISQHCTWTYLPK